MNPDRASFNRLKLALLASLSLFSFGKVTAQTSVFQDAKGEAAYKVNGSVVSINPADGNISVNADLRYGRVKGPDSGTNFRRLGFFAQISANEGLVNLKEASGFPVDGQVGFYYAFIKTAPITDPDTWVRSFFLSGNLLLDRTRMYLLDDAGGSVIMSTEVYTGWKLEAAYNGFKGNLLWGVSVNGGQRTNIDYLRAQTVAFLKSSVQGVSIWDEQKAYDFTQYTPGVGFVNGNADFAYLLNRKSVIKAGKQLPPVFAAASLRYAILEDELPMFNPALGIYMSRVGAPQDVALGISAQIQDAFNVYDSPLSAWQRTTLNLTIGYKFAQ